jgi:hypothetical protein
MVGSAEFFGAVLGIRSRASTSAQRSAVALCTHAYRIDHPNNENSDLFYYSYCKQGPIAERAPFDSKKLSAITKHINKYYSLIIIKKVANKKQEIIN